ncbi:MAG: rubredoxin-like domain-containing protein [Candidatus Dojkabacteria bacterium]|jgi:hypothetical protein
MEDILKNDVNSNNVVPNSAPPTSTPVAPPQSFPSVPTDSQLVEDLDIRWLRWKCLVCGYVHEGVVPMKVCPKCGNSDLDKFDDAE